MTFLRFAAVLLLILVVDVAAQSNADGRWRAVFENPADAQLTFNEVILVLTSDGAELTGTADIGHTALARWPGLAPIAEGKIDGDEFSFTWTGPSSARFPPTRFTGTVDGDRMKLTMTLGDGKIEMKGERLPSQ